MQFSRYTCSLASGLIEYGFAFHLDESPDDTEFDLVLGAIKPGQSDIDDTLENAWTANEWAAIAIVEKHSG